MERYIELFWECLPSLISGLKFTIMISIYSLLFAFVLGIILAILGISKIKTFVSFYNTYISIIRSIPVMILGLFLYFGIGSVLPFVIPPFWAAVITLTINASAYMAEIFRAGIQAIDIGQMEAARSLGLSYGKSMLKVILPQAFKIMIPSIMNQFITTVKDTSILSAISVREITMNGQIIIARNYKPFEVYSYVAIIYLLLITSLTVLSKWVERKLNYDNRD